MAQPSDLLFLLVLLALLVLLSSAQQRACYGADGVLAEDAYPCLDDIGNGDSACCRNDQLCLTNGLCFDGTKLVRGDCTDPGWDSGACAHYCEYYGNSVLWPCDDPGYYSCEFGNCSSAFYIPAAALQRNARLLSTLGLDSPTATVTSTASAVTATITRTATAPESTALPAGVVSAGTAAGIGAGIGVPLLAAVLALGVLLSRERRKRRRGEGSLPPPSQGHEYRQPDETSTEVQSYERVAHWSSPHELSSAGDVQELENQRGVTELQDTGSLR